MTFKHFPFPNSHSTSHGNEETPPTLLQREEWRMGWEGKQNKTKQTYKQQSEITIFNITDMLPQA